MKKCLICKINKSDLICKDCSFNPFLIEELRRRLAEKNQYKLLNQLYSNKYAEISDINSREFWNEKLDEIQTLDSQDGMTKARVNKAASLVPKRVQKILDVGAGYGFIEEVFHKKKSKFKQFGFDISPQAVKNLKRRFQGDFRVGSVYDMPFEGSLKFDAILALEVFEHIPPSKILNVIGYIKQRLTKNGVLIVSVPVNENLSTMGGNPSGHLREYSLNLLKAELEMSGFRIDQNSDFSAFKNFYTVKDFLKRFIFKNRWVSNDIIVRAVNI